MYVFNCLRNFLLMTSKFFYGVDETQEAVYKLSEEQHQQILCLNFNKENISNKCDVEKSKGEKIEIKSFDAVKLKLDQEEQLILEVQMRPPLWDFTIPLAERSKLIKMKLWIEVSNAMKGCLTPDGAKKKFKTLTDTFRNIIRSEKCASGSGRTNVCNKWSHYYSMEFLRSHMTPRQTTSNCETDEIYELLDEIEEKNSSCTTSKRPRKRKSTSSENEMLCESFNKVAEAISVSSKDFVLPPPPEMTEIEACMNVVACRLKKIPEAYQSEATQDILKYSMTVMHKYSGQL